MKKLIAALALSVLAMPAQAATVVYDASGVVGNQDWAGTLGLNFRVNSAVVVNQLGVFDSEANGTTTPLYVAIFRATQPGSALVTLEIDPSPNFNPGDQNYIYETEAPFLPLVLQPGDYQLASWGYSASDQNFNTQGADPGPITFNTLGGALTPLASTFSNDPGVFATIGPFGTTRFGAGSMIVEAVTPAIPEPTTWGLMIVGFGMAGFCMRSRRSTAVDA